MDEDVSNEVIDSDGKQKTIDLDNVLENELGQFGRFQFFQILLLAGPMITSDWFNEYVFTTADPLYRCRIPECESGPNPQTFPDWYDNAFREDGISVDMCFRYAPVEGSNATSKYCPANAFNRSNILTCDSFIYYQYNVFISDFNLACRDILSILVGVYYNVGFMIAMPIIGFISDRYGRRPALAFSAFNVGFFGLIRAYSINYPMFVAIQLIQTILGAGTFSTAFILATESVGPRFRAIVAAVCLSMFALSQVSLGGTLGQVAGARNKVPNWRHINLYLYVPCIIFTSYYWILTESVRWLLHMRKYKEVKCILGHVAIENKKELSESTLRTLSESPTPMSSEKTGKKTSLRATILASPILLRRICSTPVWWISANFMYYGFFVETLPLWFDSYRTYMIFGAIGIPGCIIAFLLANRLGRKPTLLVGFVLCAICHFALAFSPPGFAYFELHKSIGRHIQLAMNVIGKGSISMVFTTLYLYTSELYPTEYRHTLLAFSSMIGMIGCIAAPYASYLLYLKPYWKGYPSILFGCVGLIACLPIFQQPETLNIKMPDTLAEAEALGTRGSKTKQKKQYWPGIPAILFGCMGLISGLLILSQPETLGTKLPDTLEVAEALGLPETKTKQII